MVQGAAPRGARCVRPPSDRSLPTTQDPKRSRSAAGEDALGRGLTDAAAYHADSALAAEAELTALATELDRTHPGAAASLREGMAETLTVLRLNMSPTLARTFRSTNAVESMIPICRDHVSNVKRWRDEQMALRWCAAGMVEAGTQFRRVNGHLHLRSPRDTLERLTQLVGTTGHDEQVQAPNNRRAAAEVPRDSGHPPLSARVRMAPGLTQRY